MDFRGQTQKKGKAFGVQKKPLVFSVSFWCSQDPELSYSQSWDWGDAILRLGPVLTPWLQMRQCVFIEVIFQCLSCSLNFFPLFEDTQLHLEWQGGLFTNLLLVYLILSSPFSTEITVVWLTLGILPPELCLSAKEETVQHENYRHFYLLREVTPSLL